MGLKAVSVIANVNFGVPVARTINFATAYQALVPTQPAVISINLNATASLTLGGGTTCTADVIIGPDNTVTGGSGFVIGKYRNSMTGSVIVGVGLNTDSSSQIQFLLPAGWYYAVRQTSGTVSIVSAFDQTVAP